MDFFKEADWLGIFSDVTNVEDLEDFMNMDCGQCFVVYNPVTNAPFGFIYVYVEDTLAEEMSKKAKANEVWFLKGCVKPARDLRPPSVWASAFKRFAPDGTLLDQSNA